MKKVLFSGFNGDKYELEQIPDTAEVFLETLNDKEDGQVRQLIIRDQGQTLATFSSIVSFYVDTLKFTSHSKSKEFI